MAVTASRDSGRRRPTGYAPWQPRGSTLEVLNQITAVLDDHREYWPITPRQILYRLMGRNLATKADADKIGSHLVRGRRAGLIPWEAIGDGRTESLIPVVCADPEAFYAEMKATASVYRLDRQRGQAVYIEVFVEAAGAVEQVYRTTGDPYGVPVYSGSGFNTVTALREVVLRAEQRDVPTTILVAGDYDPAGRDIRARVADDIAAFIRDGHPGVEVNVETIALTQEQIDGFGLIRQPMDAKKREKHFDTGRWPHDWTVELEALAPDALAGILIDAIEGLTDAATREAVLEEEQAQREELMAQLEAE
jgi:hypothetical protein